VLELPYCSNPPLHFLHLATTGFCETAGREAGQHWSRPLAAAPRYTSPT